MARRLSLGLCALLSVGPVLADTSDTGERMSRAEQLKVFGAAGFSDQPTDCQLEAEHYENYRPVTMDVVKDLNGDGRLDAIITEGSTLCYGFTGQGFFIVTKQADGEWRQVASGEGMPQFLPHRGVDGWPDIEIAGPGTRMPVLRYDGNTYKLLSQP